ncbi:MAG: hypothetical protein KC550_04460 [Nanoarchaeota archaeon]|nr:hypothetical protein [Nanoarchaeota archaeon]
MVKKSSFFEKVEAEVISEAGNYVKEKAKKKLIHIGEFSILVILGIFLITFGLGKVIETHVPYLDGGYAYLILGLLFLIIGSRIRI